MKQRKKARRSAVEWREYVQAQAESGLSISEFCRQEELRKAGFYAWRKRLKLIKPRAEFIRLDSEIAVTQEAIIIITPNGFRVETPVKLAATAGIATARALTQPC